MTAISAAASPTMDKVVLEAGSVVRSCTILEASPFDEVVFPTLKDIITIVHSEGGHDVSEHLKSVAWYTGCRQCAAYVIV